MLFRSGFPGCGRSQHADQVDLPGLVCGEDFRRTDPFGNGKLRLAKETGSFKGGLILRRGNIEANCTAELLVDLCREEMAAELAGVLFG